MIRIAAVDDELHVLERFERMVSEFKEVELCGLFESGELLISYLKNQTLDVVFLDIEMPGLNGLLLSEQILEINENIEIVFVTAYNQYAVEAFELQAIDYIVKPLTEERLVKTIRRILRNKRKVVYTGKPFIQCFGEFEIFVEGERLIWKNSKAKEILAFLIHKKGTPVNWEKIVDAVWPDFDFEKAHANFHSTTYLLRKKLAEVGISQIMLNSRGNYRIVLEEISCDLYQLEERIKANQLNRKEDIRLLEQFEKKGYMDENGYEWAQPRNAELVETCKKIYSKIELMS